jgi:hypothetical protein
MSGRDDFVNFLIGITGKHLPPHILVLVDEIYRDSARQEFLGLLEMRALHLRMQDLLEVIRERGIKIPMHVEAGAGWGGENWKKSDYCR